MRHLTSLANRILTDCRAATAVEYGLIAALVVLAIVAAITGVADANEGIWTSVSDESAAVMR